MFAKYLINRILPVAAAAVASIAPLAAQPRLDYDVSLSATASSGDFAPSLLSALTQGKNPMKNSLLLDASLIKPLDLGRRFSWSAGAELLTGYNHDADYSYYDGDAWTSRSWRPGAFRVQQLFGELKYRSVYLYVGMKNEFSRIVDSELSSGDLIHSANARAIPGVGAGFLDFQNIPFTRGWVQIEGRIMYGKMADNDFVERQFNHYNEHIALSTYYVYRRCYFRTNPSQPLSVTVGMQTAGFFGGRTYWYGGGKLLREQNRGFRFKDVCKMFFPITGNGDEFIEGSSLGSWDFKARYRIDGDNEVSAYFEWPWEDGSGIGRRNGWDGLWGLEYRRSGSHFVNRAVVEYIDFRNQSGPLHYATGDHPGTTIGSDVNGGDNYFNNNTYNSYANYGMSIGTPFLVAPVYNLDGYPAYIFNRARGFHAAVAGDFGDKVGYIVKLSYQKGYASGRLPFARARENFSFMAGADYDASSLVKGLGLSCKVGLDSGRLRGDSFGATIAISYSGSLTKPSKK